MESELRYYGRQSAHSGGALPGKYSDGQQESVPAAPDDSLQAAAAVAGGAVSAASDEQEQELLERYQKDAVRLGESYKWTAPKGKRVRSLQTVGGARYVMRYPQSMDPDDPARIHALEEEGAISRREAQRQLEQIRLRRQPTSPPVLKSTLSLRSGSQSKPQGVGGNSQSPVFQRALEQLMSRPGQDPPTAAPVQYALSRTEAEDAPQRFRQLQTAQQQVLQP
jgi:hypothetical protein